MKRSSPTIQILAAAISTDSTAMSSRPSMQYRGGRKPWGRGRGRGRGFSDRPYSDGRNQQQLLTGDSHFQSVQETNLGFRREGNQGFNPRYNQNQQSRPPPPPRVNQNQEFGRPPSFNQNGNQNQDFRRVPPPSVYPNQCFRPPPQQFQPRRPKPPDHRNWEYAKTALSPDSGRFIVLSYNILADYLAINHRSKLYFHIPRYMLDWEWRKRSIVFELGLWSPDIMCLQEVDRFQDLEDELRQRGYGGIWKMRTGNAVDGCAIFWRTTRFKLLYEESIEFNKLGLRDNVAQICVLELTSQSNAANTSVFPTSSTGSSRVIICNIHVLYNPKRGEIKLGQVRLLLDRAYAVSKSWNDAPVVLCGDFNCTPKSPLYNFISEQKIELSGIDRDKVSGQASAEIHASRPYNSSQNPNPGLRAQSSDNLIQDRIMVDEKLADSCLDIQKQNDSECTRTLLDAPDVEAAPCIEEIKDKQENTVHVSNDWAQSAMSTLVDSLKENPTAFLGEGEAPVDQLNNEIHKSISLVMSHPQDANLHSNEMEKRENINSASFSNQGVVSDNSKLNTYIESTINEFDNLALSPEVSSPGNSGSLPSQLTIYDENQEHKKMEDVNDLVLESEVIGEDESAFLSALHDSEDKFPVDHSSKGFVSDANDTQLHSSSDEVGDDFSLGLDSESFNMEKTFYDPSLWTPLEIATATGKPECILLEHPLYLKSTYSEVEDSSGTRDLNGEPLVTSYNRCFLGTVDYIWRSKGLQTVRVLAPIPKHAMQQTAGFPTKKWGSDHIALASELAFSKEATENNKEVP